MNGKKFSVPRIGGPDESKRVGAAEWKAINFGDRQEVRPPSADPGSPCQESKMIAVENDFAALVAALHAQTQAIGTLVNALAPAVPDLVGTDYIARKLGVSPQWIGQMAERGDIPKHCIAPKISGGRIWKFHRDRIDAWLRDREEG